MAAITAIYQSEPLDPTILAALNLHAGFDVVRRQIDAMGLSAQQPWPDLPR